MANPTIRFEVDPYTYLVLPTPSYGSKPCKDLDQARMRAMGGRPVSVSRSTGAVRDPVLYWADMDEDDFQDLDSFVEDDLDGTTNSFTYTDYNGDDWTAYYMGGIEDAEPVDYDCWQVTIRLAITAAA